MYISSLSVLTIFPHLKNDVIILAYTNDVFSKATAIILIFKVIYANDLKYKCNCYAESKPCRDN